MRTTQKYLISVMCSTLISTAASAAILTDGDFLDWEFTSNPVGNALVTRVTDDGKRVRT